MKGIGKNEKYEVSYKINKLKVKNNPKATVTFSKYICQTKSFVNIK